LVSGEASSQDWGGAPSAEGLGPALWSSVPPLPCGWHLDEVGSRGAPSEEAWLLLQGNRHLLRLGQDYCDRPLPPLRGERFMIAPRPRHGSGLRSSRGLTGGGQSGIPNPRAEPSRRQCGLATVIGLATVKPFPRFVGGPTRQAPNTARIMVTPMVSRAADHGLSLFYFGERGGRSRDHRRF